MHFLMHKFYLFILSGALQLIICNDEETNFLTYTYAKTQIVTS